MYYTLAIYTSPSICIWFNAMDLARARREGPSGRCFAHRSRTDLRLVSIDRLGAALDGNGLCAKKAGSISYVQHRHTEWSVTGVIAIVRIDIQHPM